MLAKFERRVFNEGCKVWLGKYRGLRNIPHWHFENELVACGGGAALVVIDGRSYTVHGGECIFCRRERVHYIAGSPDSQLIVAQYDNSLCQAVAQYWPTVPLYADRYHSYQRMDAMCGESQKKDPFYAEMVDAAMLQLLIDTFRGEPLSYGTYTESSAMERYKDLLSTIERSCDELTFHDAALFMNMSEAYFSRFFKKTSGMTFSKYVNVVRVGRAIELMREKPGITMSALMAECGFNTLRNFNRVFKSVTGYPPSQLPDAFVLNMRSLATDATSFDPTMDVSELLQ